MFLRNTPALFPALPLAMLIAITGLAAGCDDADGVETPADLADVTIERDGDDDAAAAELPEPEPVPGVPYPEGPYGTGYSEIIANEGFFDPWTGETVRMSDFYRNPDVNGLVIVSAAGWCSACSYEAWDLVDAYELYARDGLMVLFTLYEDAVGRELWADGASWEDIDRDFTFMTAYRDGLGGYAGLPPREAPFPVLVDIGHTLGRYFNRSATPLTLVVQTSDMRIVYREVGYSPGTVGNMIKRVLY